MSDPARFLKYMAKAARAVSVRECVCAGVSVCTCAHVRVRVSIAQVSARTCVRVRVCMCAHVSVCACTCAHVSVRVCVDTRVWGARQAVDSRCSRKWPSGTWVSFTFCEKHLVLLSLIKN